MSPTILLTDNLVTIFGVLVAFLSTILLVPVVRYLALQFGWVDKPDAVRKLHALPTPNVGGLAIAAGFAIGLLFLQIASHTWSLDLALPSTSFWICSLIILCAGFYDDTRGLGFKAKFAVQIVVAYVLLHAGYRVDVSSLPFIGAGIFDQALFSIPLTVIWIVGVINAINLMDGLDGLAAGVVLIAFLSLSLIFGVQGEYGLMLKGLVIGAALFAFLVYNFNPASIFMGDTGSMFLGFMLASYSLEGKPHADPVLSLIVPVVVLGLPVLDTGLSIVRRFVERKALFSPDSDHIHHRLMRMGSTRMAVLLLYAAALWFGVAAVLLSVATPFWRVVILMVTALVVLGGLAKLGYLKRGRKETRVEKRRIKVYAARERKAVRPVPEEIQPAPHLYLQNTYEGAPVYSED